MDDDPRGYPRPKGATPLSVPLVPAYQRVHRAEPHARGAARLRPRATRQYQTSASLTVGTADSNGRPTKSVGSIKLTAVVGTPGPPLDDSDVAVTGSVTDVRRQSDLADYTGEVEVGSTLRITDRSNEAVGGGSADPATVTDIPFSVPGTCGATADPTIGGTCSVSTGFNAVVPGAVVDGKRSVWELDQFVLYDGGADGEWETAPNTVFARQGMFIP